MSVLNATTWIGRYVTLRADLKTVGGAIFKKGTLLHVGNTEPGRTSSHRALVLFDETGHVVLRKVQFGKVRPKPVGWRPPPTHRPSRLDARHTACGELMWPDTHLQLGDGETCERCTHVVAQVAAALRGEPSWAQKM